MKDIQNPFLSRGCCRVPGNEEEESSYRSRCCKLDGTDWLSDIKTHNGCDLVEIRFKNSRKEYFRNVNNLELDTGDIVAVEASPGHDIGIVSMVGEAVRLQIRKKGIHTPQEELKKIYRRARVNDIEKWTEAVKLEDTTMLRTREIAYDLDLNMKVNDVEYQGDKTKAIFYYTAEERVDFRQLIKVLAEQFRIRIEMKQIGVRQEAARVGGIGSCGRELCCATWMSNFKSVTTNTARTQQLSLNPQKLAGQCGKLKCCLNYETDCYVDTLKEFPSIEIILKSKKGEATYQKADVFKKLMWYSYVDDQSNIMAIPVDKVKKIIDMNKKGQKPDKLEDFAFVKEQKTDFENAADQTDLTRFDD